MREAEEGAPALGAAIMNLRELDCGVREDTRCCSSDHVASTFDGERGLMLSETSRRGEGDSVMPGAAGKRRMDGVREALLN